MTCFKYLVLSARFVREYSAKWTCACLFSSMSWLPICSLYKNAVTDEYSAQRFTSRQLATARNRVKRLFDCCATLHKFLFSAHLWIAVDHSHVVSIVSTWAVLNGPKPNQSTTWCEFVINRPKETIKRCAYIPFHTPRHALTLLG